MNTKISQKHDNMHRIKNNSVLKFIYDDKNEFINGKLSKGIGDFQTMDNIQMRS